MQAINLRAREREDSQMLKHQKTRVSGTETETTLSIINETYHLHDHVTLM